MTKTKYSNELKLIVFCAVLGTVSGGVLWLFLKTVQLGTEFLWDRLPQTMDSPVWYPIVVCVAGGALIGVFRKHFGDYPESMQKVIGTVKKTGTYPYQKILVILVAAALPLILGSSVGPEAGMVGVLIALGCWVNENVKFAKKNAALFSGLGMAVSLSALFYSPLFGFFSAVEDEGFVSMSDQKEEKSRSSVLLIYGISIVSSMGIMAILNQLFGNVSEGFPSFENAQPNRYDLAMIVVYLICGVILGIFFEKMEVLFEMVSKKIPPVLCEAIAGLILGCIVAFLPVVQFSGESQMAVLLTDYAKYAPLAMIGIAFLKILMTTMCIQMGLKGGHFFPVIFSAVCLGYGISLLVFPMDAAHATFAAAITTAAALGVSMKKPLAVTCLLFLVFPVKMGIWIFLAAILAAKGGSLRNER